MNVEAGDTEPNSPTTTCQQSNHEASKVHGQHVVITVNLIKPCCVVK